MLCQGNTIKHRVVDEFQARVEEVRARKERNLQMGGPEKVTVDEPVPGDHPVRGTLLRWRP